MRDLKKSVILLLSMMSLAVLSNCRETREADDDLDDAVEAVEDAADDTGDAIEDAADDVEDELDGDDN